MSTDQDKKGEELGYVDGVRYSLRETEKGEFEVHSQDFIHNREEVLKTFKSRDAATQFAEDFLA